MLTATDLSAWVEIQDGLARAAEREWEAARQWEFYERRRLEIDDWIAGVSSQVGDHVHDLHPPVQQGQSADASDLR